MTTTETAPYEGPVGGDWSKGRFEFFHNACGTIFADSQDEAIAFAYQRIKAHDPLNAAAYAIHVQRIGFNESGAALPATPETAEPNPAEVSDADRADYEAWKASQVPA